jgi:hypothetical protein
MGRRAKRRRCEPRALGLLTPRLFSAGDDLTDARAHLSREGYVVFRSPLRVEGGGLNGLWDEAWRAFATLEPGLQRDDRSTWTDARMSAIADDPSTGMAWGRGVAHSDLCWRVRTNETIRRLFAALLCDAEAAEEDPASRDAPAEVGSSTALGERAAAAQLRSGVGDARDDGLCVGFDGICVQWRVAAHQRRKPWLHRDQNRTAERAAGGRGVLSLQGALNLLPVDASDGGFVVVPRSHRDASVPPAPLPSRSTGTDDAAVPHFVMLPFAHPAHARAVKLLLPEPGTLVVWNSLTLHASHPGTSNRVGNRFGGAKKKAPSSRTKTAPELNRLTVFVSYALRRERSDAVRRAKADAYRAGFATSHWAQFCHLKSNAAAVYHARQKARQQKQRSWGDAVADAVAAAAAVAERARLSPRLSAGGAIPPQRAALF